MYNVPLSFAGQSHIHGQVFDGLLHGLEDLVGAVVYQEGRGHPYLAQVRRRRPHGGEHALPPLAHPRRAAARADVVLAAVRGGEEGAAGDAGAADAGKAAVLARLRLHLDVRGVFVVLGGLDGHDGCSSFRLAWGQTTASGGERGTQCLRRGSRCSLLLARIYLGRRFTPTNFGNPKSGHAIRVARSVAKPSKPLLPRENYNLKYLLRDEVRVDEVQDFTRQAQTVEVPPGSALLQPHAPIHPSMHAFVRPHEFQSSHGNNKTEPQPM